MKKNRFTTIMLGLVLTVFLQLGFIGCSNDGIVNEMQLTVSDEIIFTEEEIAWLEENHLVRIRVGDWQPFMCIDENGESTGIAIEYIQAVFDSHGINYKLIANDYTFAQALHEIEVKGDVDMVPTAKITEERMEYMVFSKEYISSPWVIFTRNNWEFISSIDDLKGKTIAVPEGYVINDLIETHYPEINIQVVTESAAVENSLKSLSVGEVDAYIGNLMVGSYIVNINGYQNIKIAAPTPFEDHANAMGIRDDWPELASIINKSLETIDMQQKQQLNNKWLSIRYEYGIHIYDVIKWGLILIVVLGIAFIPFYIWHKKLELEIRARRKAEKENIQMIHKLEEMVNIDNLTNIMNSRSFMEALIEKLNNYDNLNVYTAFCMIDIDDFKEVNDKYGHQEGDVAITTMVDIIKAKLPEESIFGRLGGEEFGICLQMSTKEECLERVEEIFRNVRGTKILLKPNVKISLTISMGIVFFNEEFVYVEDIYKEADMRMYMAKKRGKDCYIYKDNMK